MFTIILFHIAGVLIACSCDFFKVCIRKLLPVLPHDVLKLQSPAAFCMLKRPIQMRDRILADTALICSGGDVFARRYLLDPKTGNPLPTYERRRYRGGFGYALPVFVYLE